MVGLVVDDLGRGSYQPDRVWLVGAVAAVVLAQEIVPTVARAIARHHHRRDHVAGRRRGENGGGLQNGHHSDLAHGRRG